MPQADPGFGQGGGGGAESCEQRELKRVAHWGPPRGPEAFGVLMTKYAFSLGVDFRTAKHEVMTKIEN